MEQQERFNDKIIKSFVLMKASSGWSRDGLIMRNKCLKRQTYFMQKYAIPEERSPSFFYVLPYLLSHIFSARSSIFHRGKSIELK